MRHLRLLVFICLIGMAASLSAQIDTVFLLPPQASESDEIAVGVHITIPNQRIDGSFAIFYEQLGDSIFLNISYCYGPLTVIDEVRDTIGLGTFPAGNYTLMTTLNLLEAELSDPTVCNLAGTYRDTLAFVVDAVTSIPEIKRLPLQLFPNPARQALQIEAPVGIIEVILLDVNGRRESAWQFAGTARQVQLSWGAEIRPGMYWLRLRLVDGRVVVRKVIVGS